MASTAISMSSARIQSDRYRDAERRLWDYYGLEPTDRFLDIPSPAARLRVLEVGSGEPVLLVHGTVGPGSWPSLIHELAGYRWIVVERPGWGLSAPIDFSERDYKTLVAGLLRGVLDTLGLERAHVVGGSIGNVWALGLAAQHPSRVGRIVLLGGGPVVREAGVPGIIRLLASPAGALMVRLPDTPGRLRSILRRSGHGASLDAGRIPAEFLEWRSAAARAGAMRHEREMVCAIVRGTSYRPGVTFSDGELAAIQQPTLHVYGTADPVGSVDVWKRVAATLPRGELRLVEGAGHMPWFDDPHAVAAELDRLLSARGTSHRPSRQGLS
jgi:pimeloyl-ACP methyl ester carboxylesterase